MVGSLIGLCPQHVINALDAPLYTPIITSLANLLDLMVGRIACEVVRLYLVGMKSFALVKERDETKDVPAIYLVANGNFKRKWVSKCLTKLNRGILSKRLTSECIGIGVSCVTELVVHTIKKHWGAASMDQNTTFSGGC
eukprot:TRINITY_DN5314_c0_g2_i12.p2 TRINITY_DN5314_c0_g2~~TRINITY_DN5314_c0_g2_i12.p2  ORF type:complete len:139 (-),score=19.30 TRINITY_DN5314_c0_g2_i12:496-912(-)